MPNLVILSGANAGDVYELVGREMVAGRDSTCDIVFPSRTVSRQHCRFVQDGEFWCVEDMGSVNGTEVNGRTVKQRTRLGDQDRIRVFNILLMFEAKSMDLSVDLAPAPIPTTPTETVRAKIADIRRRTDKITGRDEPTIVAALNARTSATEHAATNAELKLKAILEIVQSVGSALELDVVLPRILEGLVRIFPQANRAYILQEEERTGELKARAIHDLGDSTETINPVGGQIASRVMAEGSAFLSGDAINDQRLEQMAASIFEERIRSFICAPLMGPQKKPLGVIHVETHNAREPFNQLDLDVLVSAGQLAGQAVEYAAAYQAQREFDNRKNDWKMARDVQLHFMPSSAPECPGYSFFHYYRAASEMGGDYFDYVELPDGKVAVVQGDVSGKGAAASLVMARLCSDVRYLLLSESSPSLAMQRLNRQFCERGLFDGFVTMVITVLDPVAHTLTLVNAGHMNPLLRTGQKKEISDLTTTQLCPPVGVNADTPYEEETVEFNPGDALLLFTDGVSDGMNAQSQCFNVSRVRDVFHQGGAGAKSLGKALVNALRHFADGALQTDDVCIVCVEREALASNPPKDVALVDG